MTKKEATLYSIVSWFGIGLGVAAAATAIAKGTDQRIWMSLWSTSLLGLWTACILFFRSARFHHVETDAFMRSVLGPEKEDALLQQSLRSLLFSGSSIDDVLCVKYGEMLLCDQELSTLEKLQVIAQARKTHQIRIDRRRAYNLMELLFRRVTEREEKYYALATELDLDTPEADTFLFNIPLSHPQSVVRVFVFQDRRSVDRLLARAKEELLDQASMGAELRILVDPSDKAPNFGIYGTIAVGQFLDSSTNVFDFQRPNIDGKRGVFQDYRRRAKELQKYLREESSNTAAQAVE